MKVIVTGGSGFMGKRIIRRLHEKGHDTMSYDKVDKFDILNRDQLEGVFLMFHPDAVIHLAACSDLNIFVKFPDISKRINVQGTRNILELCDTHGVRLLFASTCCCYGNNNTHPSDESSPVCPTEPYAQSKRDSEYDILNSIKERDTKHTCMRLATFYGPEMRKALAPAIFIDNIQRGEVIEIHGSGDQTRTMTYVDDMIEGIITILEGDITFPIVNVTTEEIVSVIDMISHAEKVVGKKAKVVHVEDRKGQIHKEAIKSTRLQSLGWKAKTTFEVGMKNSYEYYLDNGCKW